MSVLPEVRRELLATAARQPTVADDPLRRTRSRPWRTGRPGGVVVTAMSAAVAIAVAVVAVVFLAHRGAPQSTTGARRGSFAALESRLAVLRRAQTATDRTYPVSLARQRQAGVVTRLTRLAATVSTPSIGRVRVYVIVRHGPSRPILSSPRQPGPYTVSAAAVAARGESVNETPVLTARTLGAPSDVASGIDVSGQGTDPSIGVTVGIVPDGVTRVRWQFTGAGYGVEHPRPVTVDPRVRDNVAVAPVLPGEGPLARATWYAHDGHVIRTAGETHAERQQLHIIRAVNASRGRPVAPELPADYSVFRSVPPDALARDWRLPTPGTTGGYVGQMRLNYWQTRYIPDMTGLDGPGLWITPGAGGLCISDPQTSVCGQLSPRRIRDGFVGSTTTGSHQETIAGLVPDGNRAVTLVLADGTKRTTRVIAHNVYEATVPGRVVAIINRNTSGTTVRQSLR